MHPREQGAASLEAPEGDKEAAQGARPVPTTSHKSSRQRV